MPGSAGTCCPFTAPYLDSEPRQLGLLNFFLHNRFDGAHTVPLDELVRLAVIESHTPIFDFVALFALHLSRVGDRRGGIGHSHGGAYLGQFVRDQLWRDGRWRGAELLQVRIESYLERIVYHKAGSQTIHKIVTNYQRLMGLSGYVAGGDILDPYPDMAIRSCLYLAFDRYCLDNTPLFQPDARMLLALSAADELYKLVGCSESELRPALIEHAHNYISVGGLRRLT